MKPNSPTINIAVSIETHQRLVEYIQNVDGKIGKFTDKAIQEKLDREAKKDSMPAYES